MQWKKNEIELFLLSVGSLFLELLIIRWMSVEYRAFSIFKTFPLVTCFVGLGIGFSSKTDRAFRYLPLALLSFVGIMKLLDIGAHFAGLPPLGLWILPAEGMVSFPGKMSFSDEQWFSYVLVFMLMLVFLLAAPFGAMVCLGARLGHLFNELKPLHAYVINISGAIVGSVLFSVASFSGLSPAMLLIPVCALTFYFCRTDGKLNLKVLLPLCLTLSVAFWPQTKAFQSEVYWSPYQRIEMQPQTVDVPGKPEKLIYGYWLRVNHAFYQFLYDLSETAVANPQLDEKTRTRLSWFRRHYITPYLFIKPKNVLVIGAGTGNDVAEAERQGATYIDAIDIDPVIFNLGIKFHPAHPYDSKIVNRVCDDARHFMATCRRKYDLIVFGQLDSQTGIGQGSSMRLDNYIFTKESLRRVSQLLNEDGLVYLSFANDAPWLRERLYNTIVAAVGYPPIVIDETGKSPQVADYVATMFVYGKPVQEHKIVMPESMPDLAQKWANNPPDARILTDDWPYLYLVPIAIDVPYLLVVAEVLLLSLFVGRKVLFVKPDSMHWQLFFMGAAFLLLELQAIARLTLIYGSTWLTSAAVIVAVLLMILGATVIVKNDLFGVSKNRRIFFPLLLASLVLSYFLPIEPILQSMADLLILGPIVVTVATVLPVFLAGIIFADAFGSAKVPGTAIAFNLMGSVLGAMLEYLSNYLGINGLIIVAMILYSFAYFFHTRWAHSAVAAGIAVE